MTNKRQINIGVGLTIDKSGLNELSAALDKVIDKAKLMRESGGDYAIPYEEAARAAKDLQKVLNDSFNSKLGKVDMSKATTQIKNLYGNTKDFKNILGQIGPEGERAFFQFAKSISAAHAPLKQTNSELDKMAISLANTVRFGIASSAWNNFTGSISKAYGFVKNLDKSLNDIRIVSGQSAAQMEKFAHQANIASASLGATTLDYTNAALIYYQQGLSEQEIIERTNTTVKMANVLGTSTQEVSDYMTAIWNNFDNGSKSLEYYADVITALGAATASSAEEISTGLEKFAAIADTVGLSYEYATSALATVTAETRQSAEVVGTAFKTIFARIQGLELGETLEDGTTLNKYSAALAAVGIDIKKQNGELKDMDVILAEMGEKWKKISKDQQIALAQTVAGVRQYNQLVALLDNWDEVEQNVTFSISSEGTLDEQNEIFKESLEGSLNELTTSLEGIWQKIIPKEFVITITKVLTQLAKLMDTFLSGLGDGLNRLVYLGGLLMNIFQGPLAEAIGDVQNKIAVSDAEVQQAEALSEIMKQITTNLQTDNTIGIQSKMETQKELYSEILLYAKDLNEEEQKFVENQILKIAKLEEQKKIREQAISAIKGAYDEIKDPSSDYNKQQDFYSQDAMDEKQIQSAAYDYTIKLQEEKLDKLIEREDQITKLFDQITLQGGFQTPEDFSIFVEKVQKNKDIPNKNDTQSAAFGFESIIDRVPDENQEVVSKITENTVNSNVSNAKSAILNFSDIEDILSQLIIYLDNFQDHLELAVEEAKKVGDIEDFESYNTQLRNVKSQRKNVESAAHKIFSAVQDEETIPLTEEESLDLAKAMSEYQVKINAEVKEEENIHQDILKLRDRNIKNASEQTDITKLNTNELEKQTRTEREALNSVKERNSYYSKIQDTIAASSTLITSASAVWGTIDNISKDLNDEDGKISLETLIQGYSVLAVQLGLITTNYHKIRDAVADHSAKLASQIIFSGALKDITEDITAKEAQRLIQEGKLTELQKAYMIEQAKQQLLAQGIISAEDEITDEKILQLAASKGLVVLKENESGETFKTLLYEKGKGSLLSKNMLKQTFVNAGKAIEAGLQKVIAFFAAGTLASYAAMAILIGGIVIGIMAWQEYQAKINDEDYIMQENLKKMKEEVTKVKEEYQALKDSISQYQDSKNALEDLTAGTVEFSEAVLTANEHAMELIDSLGLIAGQDYSIDTNGLINIDEEALNEKLKQKQKEQYAVQGAYYSQQADYIENSKNGLKGVYKDFRKDLSKQLGGQVSMQDAKEILGGDVGFTFPKEELEKIQDNTATLSTIGKDTSSIPKVEKITGVIEKHSAEYKNLMAQYINYQRLASDSFIRAYGEEGAVADYTQSTSNQQKIVQDYVTKEREKVKKDNKKVADNAVENDMWYQAEVVSDWASGVALNFGKHSLVGKIFNFEKQADEYEQKVEEKLQRVADADTVRESYAINTLGWKQEEDGSWTDANNKAVNLDDINLETAKAVYKEAGYVAGTATTDIMNVANTAKKTAAEKGFDTLSQDYIAEAATALKTYGTQGMSTDWTGVLKDGAENYIGNKENWGEIGALVMGGLMNPVAGIVGTAKVGMENLPQYIPQNQTFDPNDTDYDFSVLTDAELDELISQFPEYAEYLNLIKEEWDDTATQEARARQDLANFNAELESQAASLGTSKKALDLYANATMKADKGLSEYNRETATAIANEYRFNKLYNEGVSTFLDNKDAFNEYVKAIKKGEKVSHDVAEATAEVQESLEGMLGLEVSPDFLVKNSEAINKLFNGTEAEAEAAYKILKDKAFQDAFNTLGESAQLSKTQMDNFWTTFQQIQNSDTGLTFTTNDDEFITSLNAMMGQTIKSREEMQTWLDSHGLKLSQEVDTNAVIKEHTIPGTTTVTRHKINFLDGINPYTGNTESREIEWEETNTSMDQKYYSLSAEDEDIQFESAPTNFNPNNFKKTQANQAKAAKGSGGSKSKKKPQEDELDRYQKVNSQLDKIGNTLDKLEEKRDKLTGKKLFDNLYAQFDTLNDKIDVTKDKIAIAIDEMNEYKQELAKDYGIKFGEDGIIQNYKEQYYKELNALNAAIDKYSASDKDSDQEKLEKAQERYDNYNDLIKKYDDLIGSFIPDLEADIRDAIDEQIAIKIETFKYELDLKLNIKDAKLEWNEFKKTVLDGIEDTDILGNTKAKLADVKVYFDDMGEGLLQTNTEKINSLLTDLKNMDKELDGKIYKDDRASAMEDLKEYYTTLMDNLTEIHELSEEIHDSYMEMMDEAQEKFDEQIEAYSTINDLIEHDKNVITMIYGEESYSALSQFYDRQEENNNKQLDFQKQQVEFWANQMALTEEGSEEWDKAKENWISAVSEWNSAVEAAIQNLQDKYLNAINEIFQKLNNEVTNGLGLDYVETQWDLVNRNAEEYLDSVNAIYNVQQLQSKYLDAIEQHDSTIQQKKLNDLMEQEIGYLREQDKLSQYDIDRANLKYEIALKQIALEEAQQNKTQLRLRRDSQGNYTYQYTQDDDQVSSIQQEIADLYNQLYNLDAEEYRGNLEGLYDVWVEFQERMAEAAQINDPEQRAAKELLIKEQYGELINTLAEKNELIQSNLNQSTMSHLFDLYNQNIENYDMMTAEQQAILSQFMTEEADFTNAAFDNLFGLYNTTVENFQGMSNAQRDILMGSIVPQWETAVQAMADKIIGEGGFFPVCSEAFIKLDETTQEYETGLATLQEVAGQSAEAIKNGLDPVIEKTQQLVKDNDELIETYNKELEAVQSVIDELDTLRQAYVDAESAAKTATEAAKNYWIAATNKDANADASKVLDAEFGTEADVTKDLAKTDTNNNTPSEPTKPTLEIGSFVDVKSGALWYSNSYGGGKSGRAKDGKIKYINSKGSHPYNIGGAGWIKKSDIVGYDTGGYTGDWGSDGRLAMLHQKELVLNASDTKNMLNAIEIVRDITSNLGATLMSRMAGISAASAYGGDSGILEQNVHITAEFPNVENSHEIEDALNNLINKASQYIQK